jgi:hypothetical protein
MDRNLRMMKSRGTLLGRFILHVIFFLFLNACLGHIWVIPVSAEQQHGITASLRLRETYDDNVEFRGDDDFIHQISPSIALSAVSELTELQFSAEIDIIEYQNNDNLSSVDQYYQAFGGLTLEERVELDLSASYAIDTTFSSELEETGIVVRQTDRNTAAINPVATFWLGPRDRMQLSYTFNDTSYDSDDFRDYVFHNLRSAWLHELKDEKTTLGLLVGATRVDYGDDVNNPNEDRTDDTIRAGVQVDHWFSETFIVNLKAGVRHTKSDIDGGDNNTDTGFVGDLAARWSANVNQNVVPSAAGQSVNRTLVNLGLGYRFTEKFSGNLSGRYRRSESLDENETVNTFGVAPSLRYQFSRNLNLSLAYSYTKTDQDRDEDERNRIYLQLRWLIHRPEWRVKEPRPLVTYPYR